MAAPKFYEGQEFHNPNDPTAPVLVYRGGKFLPKSDGAGTGDFPITPASQIDQKAIEDDRAKAAQSLNTAVQAQSFTKLNSDHPTGGMLGAPLIGGLMREAKMANDPTYAQMEGITSAVAPGLRPPGSGSSSDKDVQFYRRGFPNLESPAESNMQTAKRLQSQSDHDAAYAAWRDKWYQVKGTLLGADTAFSKYWAEKTGENGGNAMLKAKSASRQPKLLGIE
jgi:hypothetical protein